MQIGVFAKTFPGDAPRAIFTASRDAGFQTVQYNMTCSGLGSLPEVIPAEAARQVGIAAGEIVINSDDMDATTGERIEITRQCRDQSLSFSGFHLSDLSLMQDHAAN